MEWQHAGDVGGGLEYADGDGRKQQSGGASGCSVEGADPTDREGVAADAGDGCFLNRQFAGDGCASGGWFVDGFHDAGAFGNCGQCIQHETCGYRWDSRLYMESCIGSAPSGSVSERVDGDAVRHAHREWKLFLCRDGEGWRFSGTVDERGFDFAGGCAEIFGDTIDHPSGYSSGCDGKQGLQRHDECNGRDRSLYVVDHVGSSAARSDAGCIDGSDLRYTGVERYIQFHDSG